MSECRPNLKHDLIIPIQDRFMVLFRKLQWNGKFYLMADSIEEAVRLRRLYG